MDILQGVIQWALIAQAPRLFGTEMLMFFVVFTLMILMRFGL